MTEKVKLPKEVADAINCLQKGYGQSTQHIVGIATTPEHKPAIGRWSEPAQTIRDFAKRDFITFLKAMANGYEAEQTREEKAAQVFYTSNLDGQQAIERFADALNIKIQGVNA